MSKLKCPLLELATFGTENLALVQKGTVKRIELCSNKLADGLTPDLAVFVQYRVFPDLDIRVMIRPKAGHFTYTEIEFEQMQNELLTFKNKGANGFVFGILNSDGTINTGKNKQLVDLAYPLPCTFHKAFDSLPDYKLGIEQCIQIGFKQVLSSGLKPSVIEGIDTLKKMIQLAANQLCIIPGGGIRSSNLEAIHQQLNCEIYHSAAITDNSNQANLNEVKQLLTLLEC